MNTQQTHSLRDCLLPILRFQRRAMSVLVVALLLAVLWLAFAPRQYESNAKLFVRVGRRTRPSTPHLTRVRQSQ